MAVNRSLYWFTNDLRLKDNASLNATLAQSGEVMFVYVFNQNDFKATNYNHKRVGEKRLAAIWQALQCLQSQLAAVGHDLHVLCGNVEHIILKLVSVHEINRVGCTKQFSYDEKNGLARIKKLLPECHFTSYFDSTLLSPNALPAWEQFSSFSRFRKAVEGTFQIAEPLSLGDMLTRVSPIATRIGEQFCIAWPEPEPLKNTLPLQHGGELSAWQYLQNYFSTRAASSYKQTRNALSLYRNSGECNSTGFSTALSLGTLSAKQIWHELKRYEAREGANESTYWIVFELLWREYFYWFSVNLGYRLFTFSGLSNKPPKTTFIAEHFAAWCTGNTAYPLVNACINELNTTGFISNRARQIIASCLVNELGVDWRYGAAFFQQQLVDYDTAINWGNWQYIAGVGVDPRGGRHFNIEKQTELYDPHGDYINKFNGNDISAVPQYDYVGWPISHRNTDA